MPSRPDPSPLADWTPDHIAAGKTGVATWQRAGDSLERIRRREVRELDIHRAIEMLFGGAGLVASSHLSETSGLVQQQRWFLRAAGHR